jgi:cytochrome c peroxidase
MEDIGPLLPIPEMPQQDPRKVELGKRLFFDARLSDDATVSCASCHDPVLGGADGRARSIGIHQREGAINSPTVFNAVFNFRQFWDGRAKDLAEQAEGPMTNPVEMGNFWPSLVARLRAIDDYRQRFDEIYADGLNKANVLDAIATFEKTLVTPGPIDRFLRGDVDALSEEQQQGYRLFIDYGCVACHQGVNVGGNMYQKFGVFGDYFEDRGNITEADLGRYNVTGREEDRYVFKVPGLRNVARTGPYFHDGTAQTLEEAVEIMARYQLLRDLSKREIELIVKFLHSLNGEHPLLP